MSRTSLARLLPLLLLTLSSCCKPATLEVFSNYITMESRASFHARTPDPAWICPTLGQRIYIQWNIEEFMPETELKLSIHYGNRTESSTSITLLNAKGSYIHELSGDPFFEKNGIASYKVDIIQQNMIINTWQHILWVDKLPIPM